MVRDATPDYNYIITQAYHVDDGDRGIVSRVPTISLTEMQEETTMANKKLWQEVVDDYYKEANFYLGVEA